MVVLGGVAFFYERGAPYHTLDPYPPTLNFFFFFITLKPRVE